MFLRTLLSRVENAVTLCFLPSTLICLLTDLQTMCRYIGLDHRLFLGGQLCIFVLFCFFFNLTIVDGNLQSFAFFRFAKFLGKCV